jgi:hypothetical protein
MRQSPGFMELTDREDGGKRVTRPRINISLSTHAGGLAHVALDGNATQEEIAKAAIALIKESMAMQVGDTITVWEG